MIERQHIVCVGSHMNFILLIAPLSVQGSCRQYREALPKPTKEVCGDQGVSIAVGFPTAYTVYRAVWDAKKEKGEYNFLYFGPGTD